VFGLQSGTATTTTASGPGLGAGAGLKMSTVTSAGLFTNPTRVIEQDGSSATWAKVSSNSQSSTITVSGYAPPTVSGYAPQTIPAGSIVKSATVRVTHGNSAKYVAADKLALTFTPKGVAGSPAGPAITPTGWTYPNSTSLKTDPLVVQAVGGTSTLANYVHDYGFTGADMAYAATLTHKGTENLDAIQIDITYVTPAFRSEGISTIGSNCMNQAYTGGSSGGCAVLSTSALASFSGNFYIQGTTYTRLAAIDLTMSKAAQQVLRFGVISRSLWIKEPGSFSYSGPVVEIPDDTTGGNSAPIVFLTVYVCPATTTSSCSTDAGAIKALRVKARINSVPPLMTVLSWSNLR
jgi:hypothetical protein